MLILPPWSRTGSSFACNGRSTRTPRCTPWCGGSSAAASRNRSARASCSRTWSTRPAAATTSRWRSASSRPTATSTASASAARSRTSKSSGTMRRSTRSSRWWCRTRRARRSWSRARRSTRPERASTGCRFRFRRPDSTTRLTPPARCSSPRTPTLVGRTSATTGPWSKARRAWE
jgi:hypothetical protein